MSSETLHISIHLIIMHSNVKNFWRQQLRVGLEDPPTASTDCFGYCAVSEIDLDSLWIFANGFTTNPAPHRCRNLQFSKLYGSTSLLMSALERIAAARVPVEAVSLEFRFWAPCFLQNREHKKSDGSMQQVVVEESGCVILPLVTAKSYEISSRASSKLWTRVSSECIPLWELPMNFWVIWKFCKELD